MSSMPVAWVFGEARHVGVLAEAPDLALLAHLKAGRTVGVLGDHVAAKVDQRLDRRGFLGRIEPRIDHHQFGGDLWVLRLRSQGEGVHAEHDLGNLVGAEIADRPRLRQHARDRALDRPALMEARIVGADIFGVLVAGAMLEISLGELLGDLDRLIHVAVRGREDELGAVLRKVLEDRHGARIPTLST